MRGRSLLTALVVVLLSAAAAPAVASAKAYSAQKLHFIVHVGPGEATKCNIVGELYRPGAATAEHPDPAVLMTNGFGGSYSDQTTLAENLADDGYVALTYSGLGFGGSSCRIELDSTQWDGQAASQLITFLGGGSKATNGAHVNYVVLDKTAHNGRHYKYDPRVGMIGASYGGEVQFAAADVDPRIDTIVPIITWNNLAYSLAPNDADQVGESVESSTPGITKDGWLGDFELLGQAGPVVAPTGGPSSCPNFAAVDCPVMAQLNDDGYPDATTQTVAGSYSVSSYMGHIKIPVMLMQGEDDTLFDLNEAVATYSALQAQHTPVRMVWQSWGHSNLAGVPGEIGNDLGILNANGSESLEGRMVLDWFNHYLKGVGPKPALNFSFYRPWITYSGDDAAAAYASAPKYPIGTDTPLYLSGADALVPSAAQAVSGSSSFTTPAAGAPQSETEESGISQTVPLTDPAGTFAEYESAPLTSTLDVVGIPSVTLTAQAPAGALGPLALPDDLGLFVKLEDIAPNGTATLPDRLTAPIRFPDNGQPVTVHLPGIVHQFPAGDQIALIVAGSDNSYFLPDPDVAVTVSTSASSPGVLDLPVAGSGSYTPVVFTSK